MRILIAHNFYQVPGGEDAVARSEAAMLKSFGEDVVTYERHNNEIEKFSPVKKIAHFLSLAHNKYSYRNLREVLRKHRPDVAHFHNIYYLLTPSVYQACRDEGVPVVQSLHNYRMICSNGLLFRDGHVCEDCLTKNVWEGVKHRCFRDSAIMTLLMATTIDRLWKRGVWIDGVDRYIVASQFTRRKYVDQGIPLDKIVYKPHFIDPAPERRDKDAGYVLYLGRLSQEKGVDVLLNAWNSLVDIPLKIAGTGPMEALLKNMVVDGGQKHVEFLGLLDQAKCQDLLREATLIVIPSVCYENFPRVVVEAFACGVPVIASGLGSLQELVEHSETGLLFEPGNANSLALAVRLCFENRLLVTRMKENARRVFEERYSARANYDQLMRIYQDVISNTLERNR